MEVASTADEYQQFPPLCFSHVQSSFIHLSRHERIYSSLLQNKFQGDKEPRQLISWPWLMNCLNLRRHSCVIVVATNKNCFYGVSTDSRYFTVMEITVEKKVRVKEGG